MSREVPLSKTRSSSYWWRQQQQLGRTQRYTDETQTLGFRGTTQKWFLDRLRLRQSHCIPSIGVH
ncbi:hypothetical protein DPMN_019269 [Dreissena polymorpha]|uniref:Uncharacterized protein n=1 Tax=Dreissena polymorpha TaxID=45954 RepID=A0A9D4S756_DREPO|nr:hypothetical protein DPMN_019269 [Dreissena polymorpha]